MGFEKSLATKNNVKNAVLGVNPGLGLGVNAKNNLIKKLLDFYDSKNHFSIEEGTVVDYTTQVLMKYGLVDEHRMQKVNDFTIYPADYFCPMDSTTGITTITDNTVSIHHYSCSWINHNTIRWRLHEFKNFLIKIFGEKLIMKISRLLR